MNVYIHYTRLPSAYQEVEYIESSGTQWIDTGYIPTVNTEIETDISWAATQPGTWACFFGVTGNDTSGNGILARIYNSSSTTFNPRFCNSTYGEARITVTTDTFHNITLKKNGGSVDGTAYTLTTSGTPYQSAIYLFDANNSGTHWSRYTICKIKTFKISESGVLQRDLVPCYRKSDSVIGLYDLVNDSFYTNSGTGTFSKGNDVIMSELQNAYIGEYISLYEGTNGKILHMKTEGEIWMIPTSGTTIKIQDKDAGSSVAGTTSSSRGEWYIFNNLPTAPTGYHIPTKSEWDSVISLWMQITGSTTSTLNDLIMKHLLLPGAGWKNSSGTQNDIGASLYWSSTGIDSSTAYGTEFYPNQSNWNMFNHNKNNKLCMRFFKNT